MQKHNSGEDKKIKVSTLIYAVLVVFVIFIGVASVLAYGTDTTAGKKIAAKVAEVVPFPAALVDYTHFVYLDDVEKNLASLENFYRHQSDDLSKEGLRIDFTTPEGMKRLEIKKREILDKLVEDKIIEILAKKRGISISKKDIDNAVAVEIAKYGTLSDIENDLLVSYGWDLNDFKQRVVLPTAYKEALSAYVSNEKATENSISKTKIDKAKKELDGGKDFAQVSKEYSDGASKEKGGELGWVKKDQVLPEIKDALFGSEPYKNGSIIESSIGFHIIEIEDRKKEKEGDDVLQLRQIFVAKNTFADWLDSQKKQMNILIPMKNFFWDKTKGTVDFRDEQMRMFEKNERAKTQGDASIMF